MTVIYYHLTAVAISSHHSPRARLIFDTFNTTEALRKTKY